MELTCKIQQPSIGLPLSPRANELLGGLDTIEENLSCRNDVSKHAGCCCPVTWRFWRGRSITTAHSALGAMAHCVWGRKFEKFAKSYDCGCYTSPASSRGRRRCASPRQIAQLLLGHIMHLPAELVAPRPKPGSPMPLWMPLPAHPHPLYLSCLLPVAHVPPLITPCNRLGRPREDQRATNIRKQSRLQAR